jgi:hypothetical protein
MKSEFDFDKYWDEPNKITFGCVAVRSTVQVILFEVLSHESL